MRMTYAAPAPKTKLNTTARKTGAAEASICEFYRIQPVPRIGLACLLLATASLAQGWKLQPSDCVQYETRRVTLKDGKGSWELVRAPKPPAQ